MRKEILERISRGLCGVAAVAIISCSGGRNENSYPNPSPIVPPTAEIQSITDQQIVEQEVKRLGIQLSDKERMLWQTFGYSRSQEKVPINETTLQEAGNRVHTTLTLMLNSENPYFSRAANFIGPLLDSGDASIAVYKEIRQKGVAMTSALQLRTGDNKLHWHIGIDSNEVLNNSSGTILAMQIAHEVKHVENMILFQNSLPPTLSPQERLEKQNQRMSDPNELIAEEARGFGIQALAYIYAYGLGFRGGIGLSHEEYASEFIRDGSDPNSESWKTYVEKIITSLDQNHHEKRGGSE